MYDYAEYRIYNYIQQHVSLCGVVGYHVRLTRERSPVRARADAILVFACVSLRRFHVRSPECISVELVLFNCQFRLLSLAKLHTMSCLATRREFQSCESVLRLICHSLPTTGQSARGFHKKFQLNNSIYLVLASGLMHSNVQYGMPLMI